MVGEIWRNVVAGVIVAALLAGVMLLVAGFALLGGVIWIGQCK